MIKEVIFQLRKQMKNSKKKINVYERKWNIVCKKIPIYCASCPESKSLQVITVWFPVDHLTIRNSFLSANRHIAIDVALLIILTIKLLTKYEENENENENLF